MSKFRNINIGSHKNGQALVELAALGTVLIFCLGLLIAYGMSENYGQETMMQTFRKAFVRARSGNPAERRRGHNAYDPGWAYENTEPELPSNHWRNVNYMVIEDKVQPYSVGVLNPDERIPVGSSVSATCSMHLFHEINSDGDMPRVEYEINGRRYSFTGAAIVSYAGVPKDTVRTKKTKSPWNGSGKCWEWEVVENPEKGMAADVDNDGYEETIMEVNLGNVLAGVDDDGNPVTVVNSGARIISGQVEENHFFKAADRDTWKPIDGNPRQAIHEITLTEDEARRATDDYITVRRAWERRGLWRVQHRGQWVNAIMVKQEWVITFKFTNWELAFKVVDYQEGEINSEGMNDGLQPGYDKIMTVEDSSFTRGEDRTAITTTEQINGAERIDRIIRTRPGIYTPDGNYEVNDEFSIQKSTTWETPHD